MTIHKFTFFSKTAVTVLLFVLLYLFLPTNNSSLDAWGYAGSVKYGNDLFLPHHLLYNYVLHKLYNFFIIFLPGVDALAFCKAVNAFSAGGCLGCLAYILYCQRIGEGHSLIWTIFAGSSFAFCRYATENETYILPLFFSLAGTCFVIRGRYLPGGLLLAVACLFHQIHFLWWLAFLLVLVIEGYRKFALLYFLPALIVPAVYILVMVVKMEKTVSFVSLINFVFSDYLNGNATVGIDLKKALILTPVSFIRSFIQVHGCFALLFSNYPLLWAVPVVFVIAVVLVLKNIRLIRGNIPFFQRAVMLAFLLHFMFAAYSAGNAEFMVMLPFLAIMVIATRVEVKKWELILLSSAVLFWNLSLALIPAHYMKMNHNTALVKLMHNNQGTWFVLYDFWHVQNEYLYRFGQYHHHSYSFSEADSCSACLVSKVKSRLKEKSKIMTDCIRPEVMSRSAVMGENQDKTFGNAFRFIPEDTLEGVENIIIYRLESSADIK